MAIPRQTTSTIGRAIVNDIKNFINANATAASAQKEATPEEGAEAMAHAISYGIAKALSTPQMQAAFAVGIAPPSGGPVGNLIFAQIKLNTIEV